jgi:hypothetical protein
MHNQIEKLCKRTPNAPAQTPIETTLLTAAFLRDYQGCDITHFTQAARILAQDDPDSTARCQRLIDDLNITDNSPAMMTDDFSDAVRRIQARTALMILHDAARQRPEQADLLLRTAQDMEHWWFGEQRRRSR